MKNGYCSLFKLFGLLQGLLQRRGQNININRSDSYCIGSHATPQLFFFCFLKKDYAHLIWHDVTTCYANTIQKHWFHNSCVLQRLKKEMVDSNALYKNQKRHTVYNQDTEVQLIILFIGQLCSVFTNDGEFQTNVLSIYLQLSLWGVDEISAGVSFGLISTGYKMTDSRCMWCKVCVCMHVRGWRNWQKNLFMFHKTLEILRCNILMQFSIFFHLLVVKRLTQRDRAVLEWSIFDGK